MHIASRVVLGSVMLLGACAVGPDYKRPDTPMPVAWKLEAPFREGAPADVANRGAWWLRFDDAPLDQLERLAVANNPTLELANARLTQARAVVSATSSSLFPQVGLGTRAQRFRISEDRPVTNYNTQNFSTVQNDLVAQMSVNYEVDLAGRVQRSVEGVRASAEQTAADLHNTLLLVTTDLATAYFNLRSLDTELDVVQRSVELQRRALDLVTSRHDLGATSGLDVAQQQSLLDTTLVQIDLLRRQRSQFEHAIATLTGTPAPSFEVVADLRDRTPPPVPIGIPSDILERRPDVASAERAMAVANAQIGIATSAFYPSIVLGASYGSESSTLSNLFNAPSMLWSLGVSASQVLFDAGRLRANVDFARAGYVGTTASYRRVVLNAMQEVEDGITGMASLERAAAQSATAVESSRRVLDMAMTRYEGGATNYFDVIAAQQTLLTVERQSAQLLGQRMLTSVFLIKAVGGDWQRNQSLAEATAPAPR
ncbi:efflux transporter outer membrane subunit [soil metagenome]